MKVERPAKITLRVDQLGRGSIVVNGVDVSGLVRAVKLESRTDDLTAVSMEMGAASLTAEIEAALSIYLVQDDRAQHAGAEQA